MGKASIFDFSPCAVYIWVYEYLAAALLWSFLLFCHISQLLPWYLNLHLFMAMCVGPLSATRAHPSPSGHRPL